MRDYNHFSLTDPHEQATILLTTLLNFCQAQVRLSACDDKAVALEVFQQMLEEEHLGEEPESSKYFL